MSQKNAPRVAWMSAIFLSLGMMALVVAVFLKIGPSPVTAWLTPPLLCAIAAFVFTLIWPRGSWRWGLLLSSGFLLFFGAVFLVYLSAGSVDATSLLHAASVLLAGLAASIGCGALLRRGRARHLAE